MTDMTPDNDGYDDTFEASLATPKTNHTYRASEDLRRQWLMALFETMTQLSMLYQEAFDVETFQESPHECIATATSQAKYALYELINSLLPAEMAQSIETSSLMDCVDALMRFTTINSYDSIVIKQKRRQKKVK